jgi:hypothetical protein
MGSPLLNHSPRCGARTRARCPCQAPALRGKTRCRRHGGLSTGPRTAEGLARLRAARMVHGAFSAAQRAQDRHMISSLRRSRMLAQVMHWVNDLPPELAARVLEAPELYPTREPIGGLTPEQDRAVWRQEHAALAPWRQAVETAKQAWREEKGRPRGPASGAAEVQAPVRARAAALDPRLRGDDGRGGDGGGGGDGGRNGDDGRGVTGLYQNMRGPHVPIRLALGTRTGETDMRLIEGEVHAPVDPACDGPSAVSPGGSLHDRTRVCLPGRPAGSPVRPSATGCHTASR